MYNFEVFYYSKSNQREITVKVSHQPKVKNNTIIPHKYLYTYLRLSSKKTNTN